MSMTQSEPSLGWLVVLRSAVHALLSCTTMLPRPSFPTPDRKVANWR